MKRWVGVLKPALCTNLINRNECMKRVIIAVDKLVRISPWFDPGFRHHVTSVVSGSSSEFVFYSGNNCTIRLVQEDYVQESLYVIVNRRLIEE